MKERTKISLHLLCGLGSNVMNEISLRVVTLTFMHLTDAFIHVCHLNLIGRDVAVFFFFIGKKLLQINHQYFTNTMLYYLS